MTKEEIIKPENLVYKKPTLMNDNAMHYCPGCSHGVVHKLVAEVIEEMGMVVNSRIWLHRLMKCISEAREKDESVWITII